MSRHSGPYNQEYHTLKNCEDRDVEVMTFQYDTHPPGTSAFGYIITAWRFIGFTFGSKNEALASAAKAVIYLTIFLLLS